MAIKCGNCHGYHDSIQQVAQCHGPAGATDKQLNYLRSLQEERQFQGLPALDTLTKQEASTWIDRLLKMPKAQRANGNGWAKKFEATIKGTVPKHGTYTVVGSEEQHKTLRIRKVHPKSERVVVEYLYGPINTLDFRRFGDVVEGGVYVHNGFKQDSELVQALSVLLNADEKTLGEAGFKYALESGNCYVCGRTLTVPASIHAGIGPVCASKGGGY